MNVKRYVGDDVPQAMEKVKAELGVNAVILQTRRVRRKGVFGLFQKRAVEIVAAYDDKKAFPPLRPPKNQPQGGLRASAQGAQDAYSRSTPRQSQASKHPDAQINNLALNEISRANTPHNNMSHGNIPSNNRRGPVPEGVFQYPAGNTQMGATEGRRVEPPATTRVVSAIDVNNKRIDTIERKLNTVTERLDRVLTGLDAGKPVSFSGDVVTIRNRLIEAEVSPELATRLCTEIQEIINKRGESAYDVAEQVLMSHVGEPAPIALKRYTRSIALFIGPTGVGKTTTLAKLSAIYTISHNKKVSVITADTYRIAAVEQLKTYAEILDVPVDIIYSHEELDNVLAEREDMDIIFIDTAGKSPNDKTHADDVKALLAHSNANEVFLVMSATTSLGGCMNIINSYSYLDDYKLIFTKTDETPNIGMLLNVADSSGKRIAYIASGQNVPDDIEILNPASVVKKLLGRD